MYPSGNKCSRNILGESIINKNEIYVVCVVI